MSHETVKHISGKGKKIENVGNIGRKNMIYKLLSKEKVVKLNTKKESWSILKNILKIEFNISLTTFHYSRHYLEAYTF